MNKLLTFWRQVVNDEESVILRVLSWFRIVWDLHDPPAALYRKAAANRA